ncbi:DUF3369 domain-containing protein [Rhodoferax sp.]|uniref:response regulator n=1 Tax=Rhodoferax sp. TaxID=50421 RepID=UPI001ED6095A|nr:DUF3369 domain-containing protein [Rhodoferax sp.]MBT9506557.1 DUF3369 domain-containing protein [Rhodoferax sp.]
METTSSDDGNMIFAREIETPAALEPEQASWKVMIIDDDETVHEVTRLTLAGFSFEGRRLVLVSAFSAAEGARLLLAHPDTAVALVDVVMENDHAGLDLIRVIREQQKNRMIRLVLRTGQPGQAPEGSVTRLYDINDYKEKSELSAQKLNNVVLTSLRSYRDLMVLDAQQTGLQRMIDATREISHLLYSQTDVIEDGQPGEVTSAS